MATVIGRSSTRQINRESSARRGTCKPRHVLHAGTERDFDTVFATLDQLRAGALVIGPNSLFFDRREQLGALTARHAMPAICPYRDFAAAGGLMSYGADISNMFRQVGAYTARVLNGEKPASLPVQQVTNIQLVINRKTAKALGLTVPLPLLALADEVIERRREFIAGLGGAAHSHWQRGRSR